MIRLALRVRSEDAELALAELLALAPAGVEEMEVGEGFVEYAVYGAPGELPQLPDLRAAAGEALVEVSTTEIADDWSERWKRFHRPILIEAPGAAVRSSHGETPEAALPSEQPVTQGVAVPALHVRPPWEAPSARAGVREIVIDPGQAFGTGAHATTSMCLELLLELASSSEQRGGALDIGCGSGVLAIAAVHLGFAPVLGLDHEPESVQATLDNAHANGVTVQAQRFDLRREPLPSVAGEPVPVVLANLVRPLLLDLAASLSDPSGASLSNQPRHLIASGLLREEADEVAATFHERLGLRERERRELGEWAAIWFERP
jgi:ribosomal protein L11 methyltransferase